MASEAREIMSDLIKRNRKQVSNLEKEFFLMYEIIKIIESKEANNGI